jgi:hypothetical protein
LPSAPAVPSGRGGGVGVKAALTNVGPAISGAHVAAPEHAPSQPAKS